MNIRPTVIAGLGALAVAGVAAHSAPSLIALSAVGCRMRAARRAGLRPVLWTAWGRDWRAEATADSVVADVLDGYVDGGTVLLHDSDSTSAPECWHAALGALPRLTDTRHARSLRVGPLSEHGISHFERRVA